MKLRFSERPYPPEAGAILSLSQKTPPSLLRRRESEARSHPRRLGANGRRSTTRPGEPQKTPVNPGPYRQLRASTPNCLAYQAGAEALPLWG
jgi:hypothetical protein